jgi:hypothetical protein
VTARADTSGAETCSQARPLESRHGSEPALVL